MRSSKLPFKSIFISDIHLGTPECKAREVTHFLKNCKFEKLFLVGDIIDAWALKRNPKGWTDRHTRFLRHLLKRVEKQDAEVIYLRGNHDDILDRYLPFVFGKFEMKSEYIYKTMDNKRYLVVHGDGFDHITTNHKWIAHLGSVGYEALLKFNRLHDHWRSWRGKEYRSLSKLIKARFKSAVSWIGRYEQQLQTLARHKKCDGIICGHIHTPEDTRIGDIHYLNTGDWVESLTATVEHLDGRFELLTYREFLERLEQHKLAQKKSQTPPLPRVAAA